MTPEFLAAVIDTLLPGERAPPASAGPLPSGTAAGLPLTDYAASHVPLFDAIATHAGGINSFTRADESTRTTVLQAVERTMPDAFRALLPALLSDYYESEQVLTALGWRTGPPQPSGHRLESNEVAIPGMLENVRARGRRWRSI